MAEEKDCPGCKFLRELLQRVYNSLRCIAESKEVLEEAQKVLEKARERSV